MAWIELHRQLRNHPKLLSTPQGEIPRLSQAPALDAAEAAGMALYHLTTTT